jgi:hypothetical protein
MTRSWPAKKVSMLASLRSFVLAMTCLVAMSALAATDQWDDLAQKFIDQEHARFVRRAADKDGIVIVLAHPLISERVVLVVAAGKPSMSFQFNSATLPDDDAFELMARGGRLVTGKDTATVIQNLRQAHADAGKDSAGVAIVASQGLVVSCVSPRGTNTLGFLVAAN